MCRRCKLGKLRDSTHCLVKTNSLFIFTTNSLLFRYSMPPALCLANQSRNILKRESRFNFTQAQLRLGCFEKLKQLSNKQSAKKRKDKLQVLSFFDFQFLSLIRFGIQFQCQRLARSTRIIQMKAKAMKHSCFMC